MNINKYLILILISAIFIGCSNQREDVKNATKTIVADSGVDPNFKVQLSKLILNYFRNI